MTFTTVDKFLVAALGGILLLLNTVVAPGFLPEPYHTWATVAVACLTPLGVYLKRNAPA